MSPSLSTFAELGTLFLLIFVFGFGLRRSGRPYSRTLFSIHKLVALAAVIFLGVTVYRLDRAATLGTLPAAAVVMAALVLAGLFASGAMLSIDSASGRGSLGGAARTAFVTTHRVLPYLAVLTTGTSLYFLTR